MTSAEEVIQSLLPDEESRKPALQALAESVEVAHAISSGTWEITLALSGGFVRLNVGQILALDFRSDGTSGVVLPVSDSGAPAVALTSEALDALGEGAPFKSVQKLALFTVSTADLLRYWPDLSTAHREAVERAARARRWSPYYRAHNPGVVEYLEQELGRALPRPDYRRTGGASGEESRVERLLARVRRRYPGWESFRDERFEKEEVEYKQVLARTARELLGREPLEKLLEAEDHEEIIRRLKKVGQSNLLFLGAPRTSDLSVLHRQDEVGPAQLCRAVVDLLHGEGEGPQRLARYLAWIGATPVRGRWTFPTYFLWLVHPDTDFFIKPEAATRAMKLLDVDLVLRGVPSWETYAEVLRHVHELRQELREFEPRDMIDLQSLLWVAAQEQEEEPQVSSEAAFTPAAFDLLRKLHESPTKDVYEKHKSELEGEVQEPFQRLLRQVAGRLPEEARETLELEKNLFARFLKNDYGRGGVWDFYWGALYPKRGRRNESAQLLLVINRERLTWGFTVGSKAAKATERFLASAKRDRAILAKYLHEVGEAFVFGDSIPSTGAGTPDPPDWEEWLPAAQHHGLKAMVHLPREEVLAVHRDQLAERIAEDFRRLFPLVLFATDPDPGPAVEAYMGWEEPSDPNPEYPLEELADNSGLELELLQRWVRAVHRKGQAVLYGPPGTGKTYVAQGLARQLVGGGEGFVELVQFHPSYAYEDFMQGIRPVVREGEDLGYEVTPGRFLDFCRRAALSRGRSVLIVDEINRANLSRVFGELMYLLEYRDQEVPLAGGGAFRIPKNVILIGTMNTADRSIALVDHALRRRFAFLKLQPNYQVLRLYHERHATGFPIEKLIELLQKLNRVINDAHYEVGISFFLREELGAEIEDIWRMEIEPYLEEYFFDQDDRVAEFRWEKVGGALK